MKSRKGFTLVETVVAIAVVLIVSAGVLTFMLANSSNYKKNNAKLFLVNHIDNFTQCFFVATEKQGNYVDNFNSALHFCYNDSISLSSNFENNSLEQQFYFDEKFNFTTSEQSQFIISIKISNESGYSMTIFASDNSGKVLYQSPKLEVSE